MLTVEQRLERLEKILMISDKYLFEKPLVGGPNGLRLGSKALDKLAFYDQAPIAQPTTTSQFDNHFAVGGTTIQDHDTFDGGFTTTRYTINDLFKNLKMLGLLKK